MNKNKKTARDIDKAIRSLWKRVADDEAKHSNSNENHKFYNNGFVRAIEFMQMELEPILLKLRTDK